MKTSFHAAILAIALASPLFAGNSAPLPAKGQVLLLDNDELIEGDAERVGDRYRIRRSTGELFMPAARVSGVVADREAAFQLLRERAKLTDPSEHVRLARWCLSHQLPQHAIEEADAACALRPDDKRLRILTCEPIKRQAGITAVAAGAPKPDILPASVVVAAPSIEVSPESLSLFVTKVQPILMNACANCHSTDRGGKFQLVRTAAAGTANKRILQANLAAVSAFLNREQPTASPLLAKAVSVHGDTGLPPIKDRQAAAYRHLQEWAFQAAGQPAPAAPPPMPPSALPAAIIAEAPPLPVAGPKPRANDFATDVPAPIAVGAPSQAESATPVAAKKTAAPATPPAPGPADPFDPAEFNRGGPPK